MGERFNKKVNDIVSVGMAAAIPEFEESISKNLGKNLGVAAAIIGGGSLVGAVGGAVYDSDHRILGSLGGQSVGATAGFVGSGLYLNSALKRYVNVLESNDLGRTILKSKKFY